MAYKKKTKKAKRVSNHQWVYIMSNTSMPGLIKIGMTTTSPVQRNKELGSATGVPTPFKLEYALEVRNARYVEQCIHRELSACRVNRRREFFELDVKSAIRTIKKITNRPYFPLYRLTWALTICMEFIIAAVILYVGMRLWG